MHSTSLYKMFLSAMRFINIRFIKLNNEHSLVFFYSMINPDQVEKERKNLRVTKPENGTTRNCGRHSLLN